MRFSTIYPVYLLILTITLALLTGCAATNTNLPPEVPAMHSLSEIQDEHVAQSPDPWVGFNRSVYKFNYNLDKYLLLPITDGYEFITPTIIQTGVSNVFNNLVDVRNLTNSMFQLQGMESLTTFGRFVTNSTIGIAGIFDVATELGMPVHNEDFGQTLGYWGVEAGPYLVLPVFGPSSVRDAGGILVDSAIRYGIAYGINIYEKMDNEFAIKSGITAIESIDKRHQEKFRYYGSAYPFEYEMLRFLSGKYRELQIMK